MSENNHTPEPWSVFKHSWSESSIVAHGFDHGICGLDINHATEETQESDEALMDANARRIVACVNACAGIGTGHLEKYGLPDFAQKISDLVQQRDELLAALEFYAERHHFILHDANAWETVSGEPQNFQEDEANTATVEDGSVAKAAISRVKGEQ